MAEEIKDEENAVEKKLDKKPVDHLADDWFGRHHMLTRGMIIVILGVFVYVFMVPLPVEYIEPVTHIVLFVFVAITFGINSLKLVTELVKAWKSK